MSRRRLVLLAAVVILGFVVVVVMVSAFLAQSAKGLEFVRSFVERRVAQQVDGRVHLGRMSGSLLGGTISIDSIEIRDARDSVMLATGTVSVEYALTDLVDRHIVLRRVTIERPLVHLRQDTSGAWNFRRLERAPTDPRPPRPPRTGLSFGDVVVAESVVVVDGTFRVSDPWRPDESLRGAARDSAIREALARSDSSVRRAGDGFVKTRHWTAIQLDVPHARIRYPGSPGVAFQVARLDAVESSPPFDLSDVAGEVRIAADTVHLDITRFRLPGSAGSARGTVAVRDGLAIAMRVIGDTVSLADVAWLMPTFPTDGGGSMVLDIRKARNSDLTEYALSRLDVSTTESRLTGAMTFGVGGPVLALTSVNLDLVPVDFRLIERFSGKPLAMPWAGQLRGRVRGPGGPLDRFIVDEAAIEFTDANVAGVVNRFRGAGELDIVQPAFTSFRDFALEVEHLDLRTLQAVNPKFPPLLGSMNGVLRLDSLWTDVRFREADLTHVTPDYPASRFTGSGRVTLLDEDVVYDVSLMAEPISLDALAASYPAMPARGAFTGPFTVSGTLGDLLVGGEWSGAAGQLSADLRLNIVGPVFGAEGSVHLFAIDPARMFDDAEEWAGSITGTMDVAISGDSIHRLDGGLRIQLARSTLGELRVHGGRAGATLGGGFVRLDTLTLDTSAGRVLARGGLGLSELTTDLMHIEVTVDSLGGLRPFLAVNADTAVSDSLAGSLTAVGTLSGNVRELNARFTARGRDIVFGSTEVVRFSLRGEIADLLREPSGTATLDTDAATFAGMRMASTQFDAQSLGARNVRVGAQLRSQRSLATGGESIVNALGSVTWDSVAVATRIETLGIALGSRRWRLAAPGRIVVADSGITFDRLEMIDDASGSISVEGTIPESAPIRINAELDAVAMADLGELFQVSLPIDGLLSGQIDVGGTRESPQIRFDASARDARLGEARVEEVHIFGDYLDRVLRPTLEYRTGAGVVAMTADAALPMDLSFAPVANRRLDLPLEGSLKADSTALSVLETFSTLFVRANGRLDADLALGGTWKQPRVTGRFAVTNGSVGLPRLGAVRLENLQARVRFFGDSLRIDTLTAQSGDAPGNQLRVFGGLRFASLSDPYFEEIRMIADRFRIIDKPGVADLEVSGALRLVGPMSRAVLSGADTIVINRNIYIPDAARRDVVSLDDIEFFSLTDTTMLSDRRLLPGAPSTMVENLSIQNVIVAAGPSLWLRSNEANIKLGGALQLRTGPSQGRDQDGRRQFALDGTLFAEQGGTYRLNLGVIQKTFIVEFGTIRFFGQPDLNPTVDISALHTVRQYDQRNAQQDVRIRVTLGGTLARMTAVLSSPDSLRISGDDLISYLVTGAPDFGIGGRASYYTTTAARIAVSSLGSVLGSTLAGGAVDVVDVRTAGLESGYGGDARSVGGNILAGTRIGAGKQIGDKAFLRADFGLCQVGQVASGDQSFDPVAFANAVGVKIDYRFEGGVGLSFGLEPPTSALLCASGASARGFVPTPRQWGFDLFRLWRF